MPPTQPVPPPPPPPPPRTTNPYRGARSHDHVESPAFIIHGDNPKNTEIEFPKPSGDARGVSLRAVVSQYLGAPQSSRASASKLMLILGRLRWLQHAIDKYNDGLTTASPGFVHYWRQCTLNLLSGFGYRAEAKPGSVSIAGLADLIDRLEFLYRGDIKASMELIGRGMITFGGLGELFRPDVFVTASIISGGTPSVFRVTDSYFEEHRTLFGSQKRFRVTMEAVVLVGAHFSVASFSEVFLSWSGAQARSLSEFAYRPVSEAQQQPLEERAEKAVTYGLGGAKYLAYSPNCFYIHSSRTSAQGRGPVLSRTSSSQSLTGGRIMIDAVRGASLGHFPCQGMDEATLAIIGLSRRYLQWLSRHGQSEIAESESLCIWDQVPQEFRITCWPALVGFSFTAKAWGHVLVAGLSSIGFQDQAFDRLVLSAERKQIIQAVVRCGMISQAQDLVAGKQGGLVFLLHGPPGVGKTLTAEAVAEVLHRPLYYISMGELGVTPDDLEMRLTDVLALCAEWDAIAVLDEADVFLETRSSSDLVRNAMVCVMLRILEYHPGILFLTTNRVRTLDPAFESRITMALRYEALDEAARTQVWKNQLGGTNGEKGPASSFDYGELAQHPLNGRQIKNTVRLSLSLATDQGTPLTQSLLLKTLEVTSLGRRNMKEDMTWEQLEATECRPQR
ncbi:hypothetical protein K4F52_008935 [Lecanicillium sp. MT-2017a]|nr:hypothetical protein K4F52_008935 [Lecanicillium sp. MT-2017a]